ncbi:MAG TPA: hypothetical protein VH459_05565 [Gaiellales bacterium]
MTPKPDVEALRAERSRACRLTPDRALRDIQEAAAWVRERGIVTITPDCALPSLFAACHEPPYKPGSRGFGLWPRTKYPWAVELTAHPGIHGLKVHRGKRVLVSDGVAAILDPLCRAAVKAAAASPLVAHLEAAGPSLVEDLQVELGLAAGGLRRLRAPLESAGAIVSRSVTVPARTGGHRHTSELRLWTQAETPVADANASPEHASDDLLVAGVRAAVLAPEDEVRRWFSWPVPQGAVQRLVGAGRLSRPSSGWLTA